MKTATTKFSMLMSTMIHDYYWEHGYVIISKLLQESLIDAFIREYNIIKQDKDFVFYSQSTHRALKPILSEHGYIIESMEGASRYGLHPNFAGSIKKCLHGNTISKVLSLITGSDKHVMWHTMFFDRSIGTVEHQDHWYLDTNPSGGLVGVWYSLEDIHEDSGPFFVVPDSHKNEVVENSIAPTHDDFVRISKEMIRKNQYEFEACLLNKGDVLFWHPMLVHGSLNLADEQYSRKSFTAHFYPYGMSTTLGSKTPSLEETGNPDLLSFYRCDDIEYNRQLNMLYESYQGADAPIVCDMRRESYKNS